MSRGEEMTLLVCVFVVAVIVYAVYDVFTSEDEL